MQLPLGPDPRTDVLRRMQAALIARFGRIVRPPEKRRDAVWVLVQGVIGARTKTRVSNEATDRLLADFGTWEAIAQAPIEALETRLANQTFPDIAAMRLKDSLLAVIDRRGAVNLEQLADLPTAEAMAWLETLPGVARKISAGVMNASHFERRALVIDSHHRRIIQRMGLVPPNADTARAYDALMPVLPEEWSAADIDEHHLLVKRLGQTLCRPRRPQCADCPIRSDCRTGRAKRDRDALAHR
ncbi:endonuclease III domain-containing protein [Pelagerythrobacter aerophilus]|uniref:Endonuclease III n=1 Tax=Pelagerythrobacter aerophilus TaxID=2306995 RepID=A0A418NET3_9SPHN|nr:endonuclease III [Pelagerythrobacter aerophilus]RIV75744.1 endonuclease III [Pelagerythrobacter aerophilus]